MKCTQCNMEKDISEFHKRKDTKSGVRKNCKVCANTTTAKGNSKNASVKSEYDKKWYNKNKTKRIAQSTEWYQNNRYKACIVQANRRQRTPTWLDKYDNIVMDFIYKTCSDLSETMGVPFEVDHIVPLKGKFVSGLHCPDNLQILTASQNRSKSNIYEVA